MHFAKRKKPIALMLALALAASALLAGCGGGGKKFLNIATGGTAEAAAKLVERLGATVVKMAFLIELVDLGGRVKLAKYPVDGVIGFPGH